jgi:hypothetical protein
MGVSRPPGLDFCSVLVSNCFTKNYSFAELYESLRIYSSCTNLSSQVSGYCDITSGDSVDYCNYIVSIGVELTITMTNSIDGLYVITDDSVNLTVTPPTSAFPS